jgi:hypothetical protein
MREINLLSGLSCPGFNCCQTRSQFQVLYLEISDVGQNEHASSPNTRPEMTSGEHDVFTVIRGGRATLRSRDQKDEDCAHDCTTDIVLHLNSCILRHTSYLIGSL